MKVLRVADFFCGSGGWSEGFRQKGFDVVFATDVWKPAMDTHSLNHPRCAHLQLDILKIEPGDIDSVVPDTEVILGSPPCVSFSNSNNYGKSDKTHAMKLVMKFLQIVAHKKNKKGSILRYWVMENVPKSAKFVKDSYTFTELGLEGGGRTALEIKERAVLNSADFGVPQTRRRFFCGEFPVPSVTHDGSWVPLSKVLARIGNPGSEREGKVSDPNYGFRMDRKLLTDHHYDTTVPRSYWKKSRMLKTDHSFMGKITFPENPERPGRTVMATNMNVSRESLMLKKEGAGRSYRSPTIRELSCIMSFPITYQFPASSESVKHRLVGNSVCPIQAAAIAGAIRKSEGLRPVSNRTNYKDYLGLVKDFEYDLTGSKRKRPRKKARPINSRFRMHVPRLKVSGFRVDLDNLESFRKTKRPDKFVWKASLHHGTGKVNAKKCEPDMKEIISLVKKSEHIKDFHAFASEMREDIKDTIPDSMTFQKLHCGRVEQNGFVSPHSSLEMVSRKVRRFFGNGMRNKNVDNSDGAITIGKGAIPVPILASLYGVKLVEESLKRKQI